MDKILVCPITMETIVHAGMNCYGNIYEYDAIVEWFKNHNTDPVTREICPSKYVVKVNINDKNLETRQKDMRLTTELVFPITKQWSFEKNLYLKYLEYQKNIKNIPEDEFAKYQRQKKNYFCNDNNRAYYNCCSHVEKDDTDVFYDEYHIRDFDFIDLSNSYIWEKKFKSQRFVFTDLSDSTFIGCDFSRCTFIGCDMRNVRFVGCRFIGEEVCFYKSDCKNMKIVRCKIEPIDRWVEIDDLQDMVTILHQRKMSGKIEIVDRDGMEFLQID